MIESFKNIFYHYGFGLTNALVAAALIYFGIKTIKRLNKILLYNVSAIFLALFLFETYDYARSFFSYNPDSYTGTYYSGTFFDNKDFTHSDSELGYGIPQDTSFCTTAIRHNNEQLIYRATYCFENGMRKTPGANYSNTRRIWFLGCSFTFGDGLNDDETLPYYFNSLSKKSFNAYNFGFSGYGTHQALKQVEKNILTCASTQKDTSIVIYSFIPEHFIRAAGKSLWDKNGPWYEVENAKLTYKGSFERKHSFKENYFTKRIAAVWHSSYLYRSFFTPVATNEDVTRVTEMVKKMNAELQHQGIKFYVLANSGKEKNENYIQFIQCLKQSNINVFQVDSIITDVNTKPENYYIEGDGHPSKNYNKKVAAYLVSRICN